MPDNAISLGSTGDGIIFVLVIVGVAVAGYLFKDKIKALFDKED